MSAALPTPKDDEPPEPTPADAPPRSGVPRVLLVVAGWICLVLAIAGVALPLLPTTPFLLLAGACFVRSSPRLHAAMLADPRFGPYLEQWQRDRSIPRHAKNKAYVVITLTFAVSIWFVDELWLRVALAVIGVLLLLFIATRKTSPED